MEILLVTELVHDCFSLKISLLQGLCIVDYDFIRPGSHLGALGALINSVDQFLSMKDNNCGDSAEQIQDCVHSGAEAVTTTKL